MIREDIEGYLLHTARRVSLPRNVEDYVQEARIVVWQEIQRGRTDRPWLLRCARNRMSNLKDRETTQSRGGLGEPKTLRDTRKAVDAGLVPPETARWFADTYEDPYPDVDLHAALTALDDREREYVYLRFWLDWSHADLNAHFGLTNTSGWWRRIRAKLRLGLGSM